MTLALIVEFRAKLPHVQEFAAALAVNAKASCEQEEGCRQFDVCRDPTDIQLFLLYELYDDGKAVEGHIQSAHYRQFDVLTEPWVQSKAVRTLERTFP